MAELLHLNGPYDCYGTMTYANCDSDDQVDYSSDSLQSTAMSSITADSHSIIPWPCSYKDYLVIIHSGTEGSYTFRQVHFANAVVANYRSLRNWDYVSLSIVAIEFIGAFAISEYDGLEGLHYAVSDLTEFLTPYLGHEA